jgi:hypothetical protein
MAKTRRQPPFWRRGTQRREYDIESLRPVRSGSFTGDWLVITG